MAREVRQAGVELHGNSFRYRLRLMEEGQKRTATYRRWPFVVGAEGKALAADDPLRRENALANANAFALRDRQKRKSPQRVGGFEDPKGTLLEWLIRYQMEALELRRYDPRFLGPMVEFIQARSRRKKGDDPMLDPVPVEKLTFHCVPRVAESVDHDKSQIRSILRLSGEHTTIDDMLHSQVQSLGSQHIHQLLALWAKGKARAKTKRKLLSMLAAVWKHHEEFHGMRLEKPWASITIRGDGEKPKARAIPKAELAKIEGELGRLHPFVRGAIEFLRWTGARRSEASKLRWEKLMWPEAGAPSAHFERTKAKRGVYRARFVYLEDECIAALARMVKPVDQKGEPIVYDAATFDWRKFDWPKKGWVFPSPKNPEERVAGQTIYQAFTRCVEHAGVPHASPHHLRHTKATVLTATVPQAMAQEMLGHEDAATFAIYRHLAEEAGYMVRDKTGMLVGADELKSKEDIVSALKKLPLKDRAEVLSQLLGG